MATKKKAIERLTMDRSGDFHVWADGPNHCGVVNDLFVKYAMTCECLATTDSRGFLFEQLNVDRYFKGIAKTKLSCEKLTISCVKDLMKMIKKENPSCTILRMDLTLSPAPHAASMKYSWVAEQKEELNSK